MLLWSSGLWRRSEKLLATLVFPGGPALALFAGPALLMTASPESPCITSTSTAVATAGQVIPPAVAGGGQLIPAAEACTSSALAPVLGIALLLFVLIAPVVVVIVLLNRARSRAALENH
jgi:hypothetical protein